MQEIENAEESGASIQLINEKFAERQKQLERSVNDFKLNSLSNTLGGIKDFLGEQTAVGKAVAIAQTSIDTYQAAQKAYASQLIVGDPTSPIRAGIAAGVAVSGGLANIAKITATSTKFEKGGISRIQGASHAGGGVPIYAGSQYIGEAEGDEGIGILNKAAFADFMNYNDSFNSGKSTNGKFEGGGIITQAVGSNSNEIKAINDVAKAISEMEIFVAVEDINNGQGDFANVVNGANG